MDRFKNTLKRMGPLLIVLLIVFIYKMLKGGMGSFSSWFYWTLVSLPGIIVGLAFHEWAHAFVSDKLGDPLPRNQGRVTLNPFHHIDPFGFLCLIFVGFGWGVPVQIDPRYYKNRRRGEIMVALAGVITNFLIAAVLSMAVRLLIPAMGSFIMTKVGVTTLYVILSAININLVLMVFNLIPVPPLDGFSVITQIFRLDEKSWYYDIYRNAQLILIILVVFNIPWYIIEPVRNVLLKLLLGSDLSSVFI